MATILNTSGGPIYPGDLIEWALANNGGTPKYSRAKASPRRIGIAVASAPVEQEQQQPDKTPSSRRSLEE
eukprot:839843-Prymnesium_polylepis.1